MQAPGSGVNERYRLIVSLDYSQLRILGFGFFQDGDIWVGVFPEGEEDLI